MLGGFARLNHHAFGIYRANDLHLSVGSVRVLPFESDGAVNSRNNTVRRVNPFVGKDVCHADGRLEKLARGSFGAQTVPNIAKKRKPQDFLNRGPPTDAHSK